MSVMLLHCQCDQDVDNLREVGGGRREEEEGRGRGGKDRREGGRYKG